MGESDRRRREGEGWETEGGELDPLRVIRAEIDAAYLDERERRERTFRGEGPEAPRLALSDLSARLRALLEEAPFAEGMTPDGCLCHAVLWDGFVVIHRSKPRMTGNENFYFRRADYVMAGIYEAEEREPEGVAWEKGKDPYQKAGS